MNFVLANCRSIGEIEGIRKMASNIINFGTEFDPAALKLYTSCNNFVSNVRPVDELAPHILERAFRDMRRLCPNAEPRSQSSLYNCVGMAFANRRTQVDAVHIPKFLEDDRYRQIHESEACRGDIVVYFRDDVPRHVGVVWEIRPMLHGSMAVDHWILSQWGEAGEYFHRRFDVPSVYGNDCRYWTERRVPTWM
ncbi:MAG TPA: hypothetical protein VME68_16420 [Acidobacteriaceae bacterium]|nr:hypothetical protein [Acidobacteriaceae bacterium]